MGRLLCTLGLHRWIEVDWSKKLPGFVMMAVPYRHECKRCGETR